MILSQVFLNSLFCSFNKKGNQNIYNREIKVSPFKAYVILALLKHTTFLHRSKTEQRDEVQFRFSISATRTVKKQLLPSLFLTSQLGFFFKFPFRCLTYNAITRTLRSATGFGGGGRLAALDRCWEFVISCKARRLRALQPLPAPRSPVNRQPLAGGLYVHIGTIGMKTEPVLSQLSSLAKTW